MSSILSCAYTVLYFSVPPVMSPKNLPKAMLQWTYLNVSPYRPGWRTWDTHQWYRSVYQYGYIILPKFCLMVLQTHYIGLHPTREVQGSLVPPIHGIIQLSHFCQSSECKSSCVWAALPKLLSHFGFFCYGSLMCRLCPIAHGVPCLLLNNLQTCLCIPGFRCGVCMWHLSRPEILSLGSSDILSW